MMNIEMSEGEKKFRNELKAHVMGKSTDYLEILFQVTRTELVRRLVEDIALRNKESDIK